jgi:hypothetical protein
MTLSIAIILNAVLGAGLLLGWMWALVRARRVRRSAAAPDLVPASWHREDSYRDPRHPARAERPAGR